MLNTLLEWGIIMSADLEETKGWSCIQGGIKKYQDWA